MERALARVSGLEQRREGRVRPEEPVELHVGTGSPEGSLRWERAQLVDYSNIGLGIRLKRPVPVGSVVVVRGVTNHPAGGHLFMLTAEVRWCAALPTGEFRAGMALDSNYSAFSFGRRCRTEDPLVAPAEIGQGSGVETGADRGAIERAYKLLARRYHSENSDTNENRRFWLL